MPNYLDSQLLSGEQVVYRSRPHWIVFAPTIVWFVIAFILLGVNEGLLRLVAYIFLLLGLVSAIHSGILFLTSEYGVTNRRILLKYGFIRRTVLETVLKRIEGVQVHQSILGRLLGYGTVVICGTGGTRDPVYRVVDPLKFHRYVQEQIIAKDGV